MKEAKRSYLERNENLTENLRSLDTKIVTLVRELKEVKSNMKILEQEKGEQGVQQRLEEKLLLLRQRKKKIVKELKEARENMESLLQKAEGMLDKYYQEASKAKSSIEHFKSKGFVQQHMRAGEIWQDYGSFFYGLAEELENTLNSLEFESSLKEVENDLNNDFGTFLAIVLGGAIGGAAGGVPGMIVGGLSGIAVAEILKSITKDKARQEKRKELSKYFTTRLTSNQAFFPRSSFRSPVSWGLNSLGFNLGVNIKSKENRVSYINFKEKLYPSPYKESYLGSIESAVLSKLGGRISSLDLGLIRRMDPKTLFSSVPLGPVSISHEAKIRHLLNEPVYPQGGISVSTPPRPLYQPRAYGGSVGLGRFETMNSMYMPPAGSVARY